jgi:hypothetical protein
VPEALFVCVGEFEGKVVGWPCRDASDGDPSALQGDEVSLRSNLLSPGPTINQYSCEQEETLSRNLGRLPLKVKRPGWLLRLIAEADIKCRKTRRNHSGVRYG